MVKRLGAMVPLPTSSAGAWVGARWSACWVRHGVLFADPEVELEFLATTRYSIITRLVTGSVCLVAGLFYTYMIFGIPDFYDEGGQQVAETAMALTTLTCGLLLLYTPCVTAPRRMVSITQAAVWSLAASLLAFILFTYADAQGTADYISNFSNHFVNVLTGSASTTCADANLDASVFANCYYADADIGQYGNCTAVEWLSTFSRVLACVVLRRVPWLQGGWPLLPALPAEERTQLCNVFALALRGEGIPCCCRESRRWWLCCWLVLLPRLTEGTTAARCCCPWCSRGRCCQSPLPPICSPSACWCSWWQAPSWCWCLSSPSCSGRSRR